jgi:hypothetical protein
MTFLVTFIVPLSVLSYLDFSIADWNDFHDILNFVTEIVTVTIISWVEKYAKPVRISHPRQPILSVDLLDELGCEMGNVVD